MKKQNLKYMVKINLYINQEISKQHLCYSINNRIKAKKTKIQLEKDLCH
jgi:hypothetical protein